MPREYCWCPLVGLVLVAYCPKLICTISWPAHNIIPSWDLATFEHFLSHILAPDWSWAKVSRSKGYEAWKLIENAWAKGRESKAPKFHSSLHLSIKIICAVVYYLCDLSRSADSLITDYINVKDVRLPGLRPNDAIANCKTSRRYVMVQSQCDSIDHFAQDPCAGLHVNYRRLEA